MDLPTLVRTIVEARDPEAVLSTLMAQGGKSYGALSPSGKAYLRRGASSEAPVDTTARTTRSAATTPRLLRKEPQPPGDRSGLSEVLRLASKLQKLVHLVSVEHRHADARQAVRMAEDTTEARSEGSASAQGSPSDTSKNEHIAELTRLVMDKVRQRMSDERTRSMGSGGNW
jgi:hypothetical protein